MNTPAARTGSTARARRHIGKGGEGMGEAFLHVGLLLAACLFFYESTQFPRTGAEQYAGLGPGFWPGWILMALIAMTAVGSYVSLARAVSSSRHGRHGDPAPRRRRTPDAGQLRILVCVATLFLYVLALPIVGFLVTTLAFLLASLVIFGERRMAALLLVPPIMTISVLLFFSRALLIILPRGTGIFIDLSRLLY